MNVSPFYYLLGETRLPCMIIYVVNRLANALLQFISQCPDTSKTIPLRARLVCGFDPDVKGYDLTRGLKSSSNSANTSFCELSPQAISVWGGEYRHFISNSKTLLQNYRRMLYKECLRNSNSSYL
jgi:hypothetical protein